jgi:hypothetical protein
MSKYVVTHYDPTRWCYGSATWSAPTLKAARALFKELLAEYPLTSKYAYIKLEKVKFITQVSEQ